MVVASGITTLVGLRRSRDPQGDTLASSMRWTLLLLLVSAFAAVAVTFVLCSGAAVVVLVGSLGNSMIVAGIRRGVCVWGEPLLAGAKPAWRQRVTRWSGELFIQVNTDRFTSSLIHVAQKVADVLRIRGSVRREHQTRSRGWACRLGGRG